MFGLVAAALLGACSERAITGGTDDGDVPPHLPQEPGRWSIETFVSPKRVVAGTEITASCVVSQDRAYLPGVAVVVAISPNPGAVTTFPTGVRFTPTVAGEYNVRCQTADQSVADVDGVTVVVEEGAPAVVETTLAATLAEAGAPVGVTCELLDAYGNALAPDPAQGFFGVQTGSELWVDPPSGVGFVVRGTVAGDHTVACTYGGLTDPTPEILTVVPGIPANTETTVDNTNLSPTEPSNVSCVVTDQWGNVLQGYDTTVQVLADDGSPPESNGLSLTGGSVSATAAGTYYVACGVEGFFAADESPAVVNVHPGPPASWIVELPEQDCFWQNRGLPLLFVVYDAWGNKVPEEDYALFVSSSPQGAVLVDKSVLVPTEGDFTIFVDLAAGVTQDPTSTITPQSFSVRVDSTPPEINIFSPGRAGVLTQSGSTVAITGNASDGVSAIESLQINGTYFSVPSGTSTHPFSTSQSSQWGLNIITGEVVDECGNRRVITQSYLRSAQYFSAATSNNSGARATSGVTAHLNQPVLDDGNRNDVDDIATIASLVLGALDLNSSLPNPFYDTLWYKQNGCGVCPNNCVGDGDDWCCWNDDAWDGILVRKNGNLTYSPPHIDWVRAIQNGLLVGLSISNLNLPLYVWAGYNCTCCGDYSTGDIYGKILADMVWVDAYLNIPPGANLAVNCNNCLDLGFANLRVADVDWGLVDDVLDFFGISLTGLLNIILGAFENTITTQLANLLSGEIGPLIEDFLQSFALDTGFSLPAPLSMNLNLASGLDYVKFSGPSMYVGQMDDCLQGKATCPNFNGFGELALYSQIYPSARGAGIPSNVGAIRRRAAGSDAPGSGPFFSSNAYAFGLALEDDLLNQALWAVWYGGGLNLNLSDILDLTGGGIDLSGVNLSLKAELPPVIMPGSGSNQVYIGLGDTYVDATVDLAALLGNEGSGAPPLHVGMYLSAKIGGSLDINPTTNEILVAMDPEPTVHVEVVAIDDEGYQGVMTDLFAGLLRLLVPELLSTVLGAIPIPEFDLGGLGLPLPPGSAVLSLTNGDLARPNTANTCVSGTQKLDATHFCLTGSLQ